jgi:paired amphipathic helix protein Sin3a
MDVKQGYYNILLSLIQNKFDQDIDQQTYEECVRYIFGRDAYLLYTIEKLVLTLLRYVSK